MAKEFIADGALCQCKFGSAPGKISVTDHGLSYVNGGKLCATTKTIGQKAIAPPFFGTCNASSPSRPCSPNIVQWSKFFTQLKIGANAFPLTDESQGQCALGGMIDFVDTGQIPIPGPGQMSNASAESQSELDPTGEPMALTEHQITALSEISAKPAKNEQKEVISAMWVNEEDKVVTSIEYNQPVYILIKTKGIAGRIRVKIVESGTTEKVEEWDNDEEGDLDFLVSISGDMGKRKFTSNDQWFSKRALEKSISFEIYYNGEKKDVSKPALRLKRINYNKDMTLSENGLKFTARKESLGMVCPDGKVRSYKDTRGLWTIGYGEMTGTTEDSIIESKEEAYKRFKDKITGTFQSFAKQLLREEGTKRKLAQYEFDAIVDLVYHGWDCRPLIAEIADEKEITEQMFLSIKNTGGVHNERRQDEYKLYTNQLTTILTPLVFYRKDNTNLGYEDIPVTDEKGVVKTDDKGDPITEKGYYAIGSKKIPISY